MKTLTILTTDQVREEAEKALATATILVAQMTTSNQRHLEFLQYQLALCRRNIEGKPGIVRGECAEIIAAVVRLNCEVYKASDQPVGRTQAPKSPEAKRRQQAARAQRALDNRERAGKTGAKKH